MSDIDDKMTSVDASAAVAAAIKEHDLPKLYANGFAIGLSNADIFVLFQRFGQPVCIVNLSYTLAKTLVQKLGGVVSEFESAIGEQNILTTDRIDEALKPRAKSDAVIMVPNSENKPDVH